MFNFLIKPEHIILIIVAIIAIYLLIRIVVFGVAKSFFEAKIAVLQNYHKTTKTEKPQKGE